MTRRTRCLLLGSLLLGSACGGRGDGGTGADPDPKRPTLAIISGDGQTDTVGHTLPLPLAVRLLDTLGAPVGGATVTWSTVSGQGTVTPASLTGADGVATATYTLGPAATLNSVRAYADSVAFPAFFTHHAVHDAPAQLLKQSGDSQFAEIGQPAMPYGVLVGDQFGNPVAGVSVQWTVTGGGGSLSAGASVSDAAGIARSTLTPGSASANTVEAASAGIGGAPVRFTTIGFLPAVLASEIPVPANYGSHDAFVRDGIAFLSAWNTGLILMDIGNGIRGGSPTSPREISRIVTSDNGIPGGPAVHNAWWFHNPATGEKRYVFVGQEGPSIVGGGASGDIHVVDVSDLANPVEVGFFHLNGAGTHNFWMDEPAGILYAGYYNGGAVAINVTGVLSGNISSRKVAQVLPGGANSFTWGVQLYNGFVYAADMTHGLFQLQHNGFSFNVLAGSNPSPRRATTDLWVANGYAYTGTTGGQGPPVMVWRLSPSGAPVLVDSIVPPAGIFNISDVEVSPSGKLLMFSTEGGPNAGFYFYRLADPAAPAFLSRYAVATGVHTATFGAVNGRLYAVGAKDPGAPSFIILDVTSLDF